MSRAGVVVKVEPGQGAPRKRKAGVVVKVEPGSTDSPSSVAGLGGPKVQSLKVKQAAAQSACCLNIPAERVVLACCFALL